MDAIRVGSVSDVVLEKQSPPTRPEGSTTRQRLTGTLHLTPHHLFFTPAASSSGSGSGSGREDEIWIPYPSITLLTRLPQTISGSYPLQIRTRTFDSYIFSFDKDREGGAEDVWQSVKDCAVAASVEQLYAFFYRLPSSSTTYQSSRVPSNPPLPSGSAVSGPSSVISPLATSPERLLPSTSTSSSTSDSGLNSSPSSSPNSWYVYNPKAEFTRQGIGSRTRAWRFTDINKDYLFSPTYPAKLVVPSRIGDAVLQYAGKYRSKARIPALTYLHWGNHASISRSSQPMVGLKNSRSAQDEKLVECMFTTHLTPESSFSNALSPSSQNTAPQPQPHVYGATSTNLIIDARPTANAMANVAMGAGTENMENYKFGKKAYLGIDNIHVMRKSLGTIAEAIREAELNPNGTLDRGLLRKSNWLRHISAILDGALLIVKNIHLNASHVLIHCSDGWDRTAQLSAVAQICLDPYYRTIDGFKILIEKDWLSFGHKFLDRSGHLSSEKHFTVAEPEDDSDEEGGGGGGGAQRAAQAFFASVQKQFASNHHVKEISPVFHQFLDCVRQIQRQSPDRFEFNEDWLLDLFYHSYSCQFGTFLFNNERERRVPHPPTNQNYVERTVSAWDYFDQHREQYLNPTFDPSLDERESRRTEADQGVLLPDPKDVKFWFRLFKRGDEEMNGSKVSLAQAQGADLVTVTAGQVDPASAQGVLVADQILPLQVPYQSRSRPRTPVPAAAADPLSSGDPTSLDGEKLQSTNTSTSARDAPYSRPNRLSKGFSPSQSGSGGWNWAQLSSSAIGALSAAGNQIKTIGSEAIAQIRVEGQDAGAPTSGEMSKVGSGSGTGTGVAEAARPPGAGRGPGSGIRIPSEADPWSSSSSTPVQPVLAPAPKPLIEDTWNRDTHSPSPLAVGRSLADLSLNPGKSSDRSNSHSSTSRIATTTKSESKEVEAALGGEQKAWDPLGAL